MKFLKALILITTTFFVCGYTNYFVSDESAPEQYYGRNKMLNFVASKTTLKKLNSENFQCEGMYFLTQPSSDSTKKLVSGIPFARLKCSDERIIELKWDNAVSVSGVDQFGKTYAFKQVKKKEYKKYLKSAPKQKL